MRKIATALLTAMILSISVFPVFAAETPTVNFDLRCNGKNSITVRTGTVITVDYYLENATAEKAFDVLTNTNEVWFDETFFKYKGDESTTKSDVTNSVEQTEYTWGKKVIKFFSFHMNSLNYAAEQYMGSFELEVTATEGSSNVISTEMTASGSSGEYLTTSTPLVVTVGEPADEQCTLTFNANGGSSVKTVTADKDSVIDLSKYKSSRAGYTFDGWYTDKNLKNKSAESIVLSSDTTLYAGWTKQSGSGGGGGGAGTTYKLTFETNGGTAIKAVSNAKNATVDLSKYITTKEGYSFDGWYSDAELTKKVTEVKLTENTAVYAKWNEISENTSGGTNDKNPVLLTDKHNAYIVGREDGGFYPNDKLTRAEAAEMIYRLLEDDVRANAVTGENSFHDVTSEHWFNTSVSTLAKLEIIKGRTANEFAPQDNITRAEFTAIMARFSEAKYDGENLFADIAGHWAENYINIAASINWVQGENGIFRPNDNITRAEVVTLINRVLNRQPESKDDLLDNMITPPDNTDENAWYYLAVQEAVNSHNYELKSDGVHEKWTSLTENLND